ncbi:MAG: hypothetical protein IT462_02260 [Planctomycetes bacterium]|nr:hypothetical protein [Planctomycetota bacterium]
MRALWLVPLVTICIGLSVTHWPKTPVKPVLPHSDEPVEAIAAVPARRNVARAPLAASFPEPPIARLCDAVEVTPPVEELVETIDVTEEAREENPEEWIDLGLDSNGRRWKGVIRGEEGDIQRAVEVYCDDRSILLLDEIYSRWGVSVAMSHAPRFSFARIMTHGSGMGLHCDCEQWYCVTPEQGFDAAVFEWRPSGSAECDHLPYGVDFSAEATLTESWFPEITLKWSATYSPGFEFAIDSDIYEPRGAEDWLAESPLPECLEHPIQSEFIDSGSTRFVWDDLKQKFVAVDEVAAKRAQNLLFAEDDEFVLEHADALRAWAPQCPWSKHWLEMLRSLCDDEKAIALIDEMLR